MIYGRSRHTGPLTDSSLTFLIDTRVSNKERMRALPAFLSLTIESFVGAAEVSAWRRRLLFYVRPGCF